LVESITTIAFLIVVGFAAGTIGSMMGVGGGIIMVPALTVLNLPPTQVSSTSLIAVTSTSVSSTIEYSRQRRIDYRLSLELGACAVPGGILGAILSDYIPEDTFKLYFGIILIFTGLYILYKNHILNQRAIKKRSVILLSIVFIAAFCAGIISSLFGVGGGIIFVPAMVIVLGLTMHRAAATSQLTLLLTSLSGVFTHSLLGHPQYLQALALSAGAFFGAQIGARISMMTKEVLLQKLLAIMLIAVALTYILDAFAIW
jgi:uncharacterized membrane protein YfcA